MMAEAHDVPGPPSRLRAAVKSPRRCFSYPPSHLSLPIFARRLTSRWEPDSCMSPCTMQVRSTRCGAATLCGNPCVLGSLYRALRSVLRPGPSWTGVEATGAKKIPRRRARVGATPDSCSGGAFQLGRVPWAVEFSWHGRWNEASLGAPPGRSSALAGCNAPTDGFSVCPN